MSTAQPLAGGDPELRAAAGRAAAYLASRQTKDGLWPNELLAGPYLSILHAVLARLLRRKNHPLQAAHGSEWAESLLAQQNDDGGFAVWHGGASAPEATLEALLALRLAGLDPRQPGLRRAAEWLAGRNLGPEAGDALLRSAWAGASAGLPLRIAAPEHSFFADGSGQPSWIRQQALCRAALSLTAYLGPASLAGAPSPALEAGGLKLPKSAEAGFRLGGAAGRLVEGWARLAPRALRNVVVIRAYDAMVREAGRWPVLPVALHAALAIQACGGRNPTAMERQERVIAVLEPRSNSLPPRPCDSGTRTAALAALALSRAGARETARKAATALKQRFRPTSDSRGGGWPLGDLHTDPDVETTAFALLALQPDNRQDESLIRAAMHALLSAQRGDGGWGAAEEEPSGPDITGAVLEALMACGHDPESAEVQRAVRFLEAAQHAEGWWRGERGICRLYGTAMALRGLRAAGVDPREAAVLRAGEWLRSIQNADGGWGEHPESFLQPGFREASSTPAQTAWALLGLLAGGDTSSESVRRGFAWLAARQREAGDWDPVAPVLPGVAYAPYLMDPPGATAWPLLALGERLGPAPSR